MQSNPDCNIGLFSSLVLHFRTIIGLNISERINHQNIQIKLEINLYNIDVDKNEIDKNIEDIIRNYLSREKPYLLEKMAYDLATTLVAAYDEISWLNLTIEKPEALAKARCAYVTICYGSPK